MKNLTFGGGKEGGRGGGGRGTPLINVKLNYYWYTYKIVGFQISAKSHHK